VDLLVEGEADPLVLLPKWRLAWEGRPEFYELSYWIRFVAKCSNILVDQSFMNSVTGSGFVAKCSNILQDSKYFLTLRVQDFESLTNEDFRKENDILLIQHNFLSSN
jgi:hypothetical protein